MSDASTASSDEANREDEEESLQLMQNVKEQVASFVPLIGALEKQVESIRAAAAAPKQNLLTDAVPVRCPRVAAWLGKEVILISEFVREVLEKGVIKTDLETRSIWLQPTVAAILEMPEGRIGFFDFLRGIGRWLILS